MNETGFDADASEIADILEDLSARTDSLSASPILFRLPRDAAEISRLLKTGRIVAVHDTLHEQVCDLLKSRHPSRKLRDSELENMLTDHVGGGPLQSYGSWAFFPWSGRLVHVLPADEHRELRTDRNRYKITPAEQAVLGKARIGVVGLSVGNMAAVTLALEGIGRSYRIADFDHLSLSNLNRLRGGVHELGINKTVLAAREMFEIDPFLEIERFPEGIDSSNIDDFLVGDGRLDLLVEECDDLYLKVFIRERCRELGIPVVMDTSDRGLFDIERFDLEPDRPVFHGLVPGVSAASLKGLPTKEKVPFVLAILEPDAMSLRMTASLPEIDQSISTWPQLASGVALGGAITADAVRRILLGQLTTSGRFYVDVEAAIDPKAGKYLTALPMPADRTPAALESPAPPERPASQDIRATMSWLVQHAILAPSAHNAQPWTFLYDEDRGVLSCRHDTAHDMPSLDYGRRATHLSFGAVFENIRLAAAEIELAVAASAFPEEADDLLVYRLRFLPAATSRDPLFAEISRRVTNRHRKARVPLPDDAYRALREAAAACGGTLLTITAQDELTRLAQMVGAADRIAALDPAIHAEVMPGYRWSREEVARHRDGLDADSMEFTPTERAGAQLLSKWERMNFLRTIGGGKVLEDLGRDLVEGSSAVCLLLAQGGDRTDILAAGRAMQRLWLTATSLDIALHPITGLPYLLARAEHEANGSASEDALRLRQMRPAFSALFPNPEARPEVLLFRIGKADIPSARSVRRPLDTFLSFGRA